MFNDQLYAYHQGWDNCGELWLNVTSDGTNWRGDIQISGTGMSSAPSVVEYDDQPFCLHQGSGNNGQMWVNYATDPGT